MLNYRYYHYLQTGSSHNTQGVPCQDYVGIRETDCYLAAALADGIGSLSNSQDAARMAVEEFLVWAVENGALLFEAGIREARMALSDGFLPAIREQIGRHDAARQMDCNLSFVVVDRKNSEFVVGQLGDCAACTVCDNSKSYVMTEFSGSANGTNSVMTNGAAEGLQLKRSSCAEAQGVILTSDGLDGYIYRKNSNVLRKEAERVFNSMLSEEYGACIRELIDEAVEVSPAQFSDDISIAVVSWAKQPVVLENNLYWLCSCGTKNDLADSYCSDCGEDFLKLYKNQDYDAWGGFDQFFLHYNANPEEMAKLIGLPVPVSDDQAADVRTPSDPPVAVPEKKEFPGAEKTEMRLGFTTQKDIGDIDDIIKRISQSSQNTDRTEDGYRTLQFMTLRQKPEPEVPAEDGPDTFLPGSLSRDENIAEIIGEEPEYQTEEPEAKGWEALKKKRRERDKNKKKKKVSLKWFVVFVALAFAGAMVIGSLFREDSGDNGDDTRPDNATVGDSTSDFEWTYSDDPDPTEHEQAVPENIPYLILDRGAEYYGEHRDGVPHGEGILVVDGCYWIGEFSMGKLNGHFQIIKIGSYRKSDSKNYDMMPIADLLVQIYGYEMTETQPERQTEPLDEDSDVRYTTEDIVQLRKEPELTAETFDVDIPVGTKVWLTGEKRGNYVQIRLEDDTVGWCYLKLLQEKR